MEEALLSSVLEDKAACCAKSPPSFSPHSPPFSLIPPFLPPFAIALGLGARVGCWRRGWPFLGIQELSQGVGPSKSWVRAGSYFHSGQPMAAKGTSHGHDQGLRWPQQALGDRMAKDSLIRLDSSPRGLLSLEPSGELRRQSSQGWLSHRPHRDTWLCGSGRPAQREPC